jgi:hypothetical protein
MGAQDRAANAPFVCSNLSGVEKTACMNGLSSTTPASDAPFVEGF